VAVAGRIGPSGIGRSDQWDDRRIGQSHTRGKDRTTDDDSSMIDQHDVAGFSEANRLGGWRKEFLCIDDTVNHADRLVAQAVHDRKADRKGIGAGPVVEIDVLDVQLTDAFVVGPFPPE
jgi:hypothetical protein